MAKSLTWRRVRKGASLARKRVAWLFRPPAESMPVFVFGRQRSGTTMLMDVFHAHRGMEVFDERADSRAFLDFRIRSFEVVDELVAESRAAVVCFKPLADSHRVREFLRVFPESKAVWIYRDYLANAVSSLRKWPDGRRAIRRVCTGQTGGGWFEEGISDDTASILREVYSPELTEPDLACLVWWARNRLVLELDLPSCRRALIVRYESLLTDRDAAFAALFGFIGVPFEGRAIRDVGPAGSVTRPEVDLHPTVRLMCGELLATLDHYVKAHDSDADPRNARTGRPC